MQTSSSFTGTPINSVPDRKLSNKFEAVDYNPAAFFITNVQRTFYLLVSKIDRVIIEGGCNNEGIVDKFLGKTFDLSVTISDFNQEAVDTFEVMQHIKTFRGFSNLNRVVFVEDRGFSQVHIPSLEHSRPLFSAKGVSYSIDKVQSEIKSLGLWENYQGIFLAQNRYTRDTYKQDEVLDLLANQHPLSDQIVSAYNSIGDEDFVGAGLARKVYKSKCGTWAFKVSPTSYGQGACELYNWTVYPLTCMSPVDYAFTTEDGRMVIAQPYLNDGDGSFTFDSLAEFFDLINSQDGRPVSTEYRSMPLFENMHLLGAWRDSCMKYKGRIVLVDYGEMVEDFMLVWEHYSENCFMFKDRKVKQ